MTRLFIVAPLVALVAAVGGAATSLAAPGDEGAGAPPPELTAFASQWPAHNLDLANTRATTASAIDAANVAQLKPKWRLKLTGTGAFGAFSSTPIVLGDTVYLQDLSSDVYAINRASGVLRWKHRFKSPSIGPNGVAYGYGKLFGATETSAFALDPSDGHVLWSRKLTRNAKEGIDMTPVVYNGTVLVSTIPGNAKSFYAGNGDGIVWDLDAARGKTKWKFNTLATGGKLWGNPKVNSGGGLWYPPAVDSKGRVFLSVANPAPLYGTKKYPNGSSRPGKNLYTDSVVALNGQTGKLLWYQQIFPHDVRDYDVMIPAIVTTANLKGTETEVVLGATKGGKAFAFRADNGKRLWTLSVGSHKHDSGSLPKKPISILPGDLGGVETPMALADNRLFVPYVNLAVTASATGPTGGLNFKTGGGGLTAVNATTGKAVWQHKLPTMDFGGAAVANDVVFTSDYAGTVYALDTQTGKTLWTATAPAGINSFPAVDGNTLLVGAAAAGFSKNPQFQLIAYSLQ